jgi:hypothetical protein
MGEAFAYKEYLAGLLAGVATVITGQGECSTSACLSFFRFLMLNLFKMKFCDLGYLKVCSFGFGVCRDA